MNSKENSLLLFYIIIDIIILNLSVWCTYRLDIGQIQNERYNLQFHMLQASLAWIIIYFIFTKHDLHLRDHYSHRSLRILKRVIWFILTLIILTYISMDTVTPRNYMLSYIVLFLTLELIVYRILYFCLKYRRNQGKHVKHIVLIGYNTTSMLFRNMIESTPMLGYKFIGYLKYDMRDINDIAPADRASILGNISDLEQIIKDYHIEAVFSAFSFFQNQPNVCELLTICNHMGARMYLIAENHRWFRETNSIESLGKFFILNPQHIPLDDLLNRLGKRTFDILFSFVILLVGSLTILPLAIILIKTTSKGPVFFTQRRTGLNNQPFWCYKFRSMSINKESDLQQATKNDSRITAVGRFLRKSNIDELPQFFNVLCGHMSVVGPRPHMLKHTEQYSNLIQHYCIRHYVKPGISGWAQVNGWRGETKEVWEMEERVKYDMHYIENWSFLWDLKIIWLTLFGHDVKKNAG